ncbi:MAG: hypothetical protein AAGD33_11550 [Actinomycetota bacterium]
MSEHLASGGPSDHDAALSHLARELLDDRDVGQAFREFRGQSSVTDTIRSEIAASSASPWRRVWRAASAGVAVISFAITLALIGTSTWASFGPFVVAVAAFDRTCQSVADPMSDDVLSRWLRRTTSPTARSGRSVPST